MLRYWAVLTFWMFMVFLLSLLACKVADIVPMALVLDGAHASMMTLSAFVLAAFPNAS